MAKLQFGSTVSPKGFTSFSTASFNEAPPAKIIRELLQNSLDAAAEGSEPEAKVRFQVDPIGPRNVPDLRGYNSAFSKARAHWTQGGRKLTDAAQEVVNRIERGLDAIRNRQAKLLSVMDNGIGLDTKRMNALLGDGAGEKQDNMSGSYGVGHLAPMALSDIRYMLYGGITRDSRRITCGKAVLASHPGKKQLNDSEGYLIEDFRDGLDGNLYEFLEKHPRVVAKRLNEISNEWGHGSAVMMLAFNNFRNGGTPLWDIVSKVAAYNFTAAIYRRKLVIEVREDGKAQRLDAESLPGILEQDKDRPRVSRTGSLFAELRPSGQNAYSALKALDDGDVQRVKVNDGYARISLHLSSPNGHPRIDLFRNGMRITDDVPELRRGDFASREPFHAVIEVDAEDSGELHRLIRKAEGPMHDSLSLNLLSSREEDSLLKELAKIKEWINQQVPEVGNEEYTVDDMLLVNTGDGVQGRESFSFWGTPTPVSRRRRSTQLMVDPKAINDPPEPDPGLALDSVPPPSPRSQPERERPSRPLPFRSAVVPDGTGRLIGSIRSSSNFPETRLMLRVDENVDFTCDRIWQDEDVTVRSFHIALAEGDGPSPQAEIIANGRFVKIHGIAADTDYEVLVEYNAPPELASVVDRPVLRLELHRPPPKLHVHQTPNGEENAQNADGN